MEAKLVNSNQLPSVIRHLLPSVGPVVLVAVGYVDPGKWAATVDGGARFGSDLVLPMLFFSFAAILCHNLAARIGVVTGKDLAQICNDEYDKYTCMFLGVQVVLSVIALDLTLIIGIAHGLNLLFGFDLSTGIFLTAIDAVLFPFFSTFLERWKVNFLCICVSGCILLLYFLGVLASQTEMPVSSYGTLTKLTEGSAFALMSLLGANIMPHNFYLHSSFVLHQQGRQNVSKESLCFHHFFAILWIFSGIYLVNYVLMNSAANVFNSTGLVLLTFPDALSLNEQVFRNSVAPLAFLIILYFTNQLTALTWNLGGQVVLHDFLKLDLPNWLQHATIRIMAIVPALCCLWTSGVEGIYQLLVFTQVMVALLLLSSVIPLFRIASSRPIMGVHKISQIFEFTVVITFLGLLGLKIIFFAELVFGDTDWVSSLRWNMGSSASVPYVTLLITACSSSCFMLWLLVTPLKSATLFDAQARIWEMPNACKVSIPEENFVSEPVHDRVELSQNLEQLPAPVKSLENYSDVDSLEAKSHLPETIMDSDREVHLTTIDEDHSDVTYHHPLKSFQDESTSTADEVSVSKTVSETADPDFLDPAAVVIEPVERTLEMEGNLAVEKEDDEGDNWEPEEPSKAAPGSLSSLASDGPPSFRSLSGKSDEGGNGTGSLSRLGGLGRAARRQLAQYLDDFWGHLYDFHGQPTQDAKNKKLDLLLCDSKLVSCLQNMDTAGKEFGGGYFSSGGRGSDSLISTSSCDSPKQLRMQSSMDSYGVQRASSSLWSSQAQLLDAYAQVSSRNVVDSPERRYFSVRTLPSSDGWDSQPATVHGYQIASIVNRMAKVRISNELNSQMELPSPKSPSLGPRNYRDPLAVALGQKLQNGLSSPLASSRYQNFPASGNTSLQTERPYYPVCTAMASDNTGVSANTKKYHSLPDISGMAGPYRDRYMSEKDSQWENALGYGASVGRTSYDTSFYSNTGTGVGGASAFDNVSKGYVDAFNYSMGSDHGSIWSKQPYEQFGIADKSRAVGSGLGSRSNPTTREADSVVDPEAKLLQMFRSCILKILKLEGSDSLFRQNDGADEDLIDRVAARERCLCEVETREMNRMIEIGESQYSYSDRKSGSPLKNDEADISGTPVSSFPHCGEGCVWKTDLIISFGVWCIHRILDLSLVESRPELWGKYTYVLNRLQGIIEPAFSKPRTPMPPCFCLQLSAAYQRKSSPPATNGMLPPTSKLGRGKCLTGPMVLELIKDVEIAISYRKGRSGTAAGDVAFPKGKENLASVLKRYKRRLSNKPIGTK